MWSLALVLILIATGDVAAKTGGPDPNLPQFMPQPKGHGFEDQGLTRDSAFESASQMNRFGIPDLANPVTKELTDLDFHLAMEGDKYLAVMFYSHAMADYEYYALHWEKASMEMGEALSVYTSSDITMARFDISEPEHAELTQEYTRRDDIPTLVMFYNGAFLTEINCPVNHHDIRQFVVSRTLPSVMDIQTAPELRKWKRRKQVNQANLKFLTYLDSDGDVDFKTRRMNLLAVADQLKSTVQFGLVTDPSLFRLASKKNDTTLPNSGDVLFFRDFGHDREMVYTDSMDLAHVIDFVRQYNTPLLTNLGDREEFRVRDFLSHPTIPYRLIVFFKTAADLDRLTPDLESLASTLRTKEPEGQRALVAYTVEDPTDESNFDYNFWQVSGKNPTFVYVHLARDRKYVYSGEDALNTDTMRTFISQVDAKQVQPKLKSEIPPVPNAGPLRVVTATSFESDIFGTRDQDSLVVLHSRDVRSTLAHVTTFAKVWRREKRLALASIDWHQNDILEWDDIILDAQGPVLVYITKEDKALRQVTVVWSLENNAAPGMQALMDFITKHSKMDLVRDEKVWMRLLAEEESTMKPREEQTLDVQDLDDPAVLGPAFEALKEQIQAEAKKNTEPPKRPKEPVATSQAFPSSVQDLAFAQDALEVELRQLMKSAGFELPPKAEALDPSEFRGAWYGLKTFMLMFNLTVVAIFGDSVEGALMVLGILSTFVFGLPYLRRLYRRRQMQKWLTRFYNEHEPGHVQRIPKIMDLYLKLDDGMNKLKEDCIRKYVIKAKRETKKSK